MRSAVAVTARSMVAQAVACEDYTCGHITRSPYRAVKRAAFLHAAEEAGLGSLAVRTEAPEVLAAVALMQAGAECLAVVEAGTATEADAVALVGYTVPAMASLSPEVLGVMALVCEGLSYPEIATERGIAKETVRSHVKRAMRATATHNATAAAVVLTEEGLI